MKIKRKINIDHHILIAIQAEFRIAELTVPRVDLRKQRRAVAVLLEIGDVVDLAMTTVTGSSFSSSLRI